MKLKLTIHWWRRLIQDAILIKIERGIFIQFESETTVRAVNESKFNFFCFLTFQLGTITFTFITCRGFGLGMAFARDTNGSPFGIVCIFGCRVFLSVHWYCLRTTYLHYTDHTLRPFISPYFPVCQKMCKTKLFRKV